MTYPAQLSNRAKLILDPITTQILNLAEGESTRIEEKRSTIGTTRHYLYSWLAHNNLTGLYKITREGNTGLRIFRKEIPSPRIVEMATFTSIERFVSDRLLDAESWDEAVPIVEKGIRDQEISVNDLTDVKEEFWRMSGL